MTWLWAFAAFFLLTIVDAVQTNMALRLGLRERMPLVKWLLTKLGDLWWVPKVVLAPAGAWILGWYGYEWLLVIATIFQLAVVVHNEIVLHRVGGR